LKQGNGTVLVWKIKDAVTSGKTRELEFYIEETVKKAGSNNVGGGGVEKYFNMIPGGGSIMSNLWQLQEGAEKHGKEAEGLFKEAMEEISQVLTKKVDEGKKLADKAKQES
jgi:hypothetical protein